jgi:MFS family permease
MITNCAFLLVFGKIYTFLSVKAVFIAAVVLFEIGSAVCGAAPNSVAFIIGRAIAGLGAAGVQVGIVRAYFFYFTLFNRHLLTVPCP